MNDEQIRLQFHLKRLRRQHEDSEMVVVDELGLKHGRCRADIAVINGHLSDMKSRATKILCAGSPSRSTFIVQYLTVRR